MQKFPSIDQFRNVIRNVEHAARFAGEDELGNPIYNMTATMPTIEFEGTVKLHGTNGGIVWRDDTDDIQFQSRERILAPGQDNAGFYAWGQENYEGIRDMLFAILDEVVGLTMKGNGNTIAVYGEWCGRGIQAGVAISQLPKMFVVFAVKINDEWIDLRRIEHIINAFTGVYVITQFPTWKIDINFEKPHLSVEPMTNLTMQVEAKCPVGLVLGAEGIGEGIVWKPVDPKWNSSKFWFKVKGEKHSASKVKTLAAVDVEAIEKVNEFVDYAVTEARLEQGLQNLINEQQKPFEMSSLGDFIRWLISDILKEEIDTIEQNGFDPKKLGGPISNKARKWYINRLNTGG